MSVDKIGVNRVGIADTVGVANPRQVYDLVRTLRSIVTCDIEFHGHNDTGCAVANAYCALEAGATHVDTSVLGIGERNGITPLGGLMARMYVYNQSMVRTNVSTSPAARSRKLSWRAWSSVDVPFNNYITGYTAFTHKAGIHAKAILNNPSTYEILDPADFGLTRYIHVAHRLTGWNAIKQRAEQLQLNLSDDDVKMMTAQIKSLADQKRLTLDDVDVLLREYHSNGRRRNDGVDRASVGLVRRRTGAYHVSLIRNPGRSRTRQAYRNRWVGVSVDHVRLPTGRTYEYTRLEPAGIGVAVIGFNAAGEILLEREYRHGVGEVIWQIPGGLAAPGEDLVAAGLRELEEETGHAPAPITPESVRYLGVVWDNPAMGVAQSKSMWRATWSQPVTPS